MIDRYEEMTLEELKDMAKERGMRRCFRLKKEELLVVMRDYDKEHGVAEKSDPSDYSDLGKELVPAPEEHPFEEPEKEKVVIEEPVKEAEPVKMEEPRQYRLMNDVGFLKDGLMVSMRAGKILSDLQYDIDQVKLAGGVLQPILK